MYVYSSFFILAPLSKEDKSLPSCSPPSTPILCYLPPIGNSHLAYVILYFIFPSCRGLLLRHFLCKLAWYIFSRCLLHHQYTAAVFHMYYTHPNLGTSPTLKALRNFEMLGLTSTWCFIVVHTLYCQRTPTSNILGLHTQLVGRVAQSV